MFEYKAEIPDGDGGTEHVVLTFKDRTLMPLGIARTHRNDNVDYMWASIEWALSEDDLAVFDQIPEAQLPDIYKAWREHDGVDMGESDASSASSTDTAKPSRRTSSKTDSD